MCLLNFERIINRALEKDRELCYQHAADMRSELQRLKRDTAVSYTHLDVYKRQAEIRYRLYEYLAQRKPEQAAAPAEMRHEQPVPAGAGN